jgi:hypothetical protein
MLQQINLPPIVYAVIYHPPNLAKQQKADTTTHIDTTMASILCKHHSAKFFISGDFNDLQTTEITTLFPVKQMVNFATRGDNMLDLVFTDVCEYQRTGCMREPPILTNDHVAISIPHATRINKVCTTIKKRMVSPAAKVRISSCINSIDWTAVINNPSIDKKADILQSTMSALLDRHCPVKKVRVLEHQSALLTPLVAKLRRGKQRAYKKGSPSWKFLSKLLSQQIRQAQLRHTDQVVNQAVRGSRQWWRSVKDLIGERKSSIEPPYVHINGEWLSNTKFIELLNDHYLSLHANVNLSFPVIPVTQSNINVTEVQVFKILEQINTRKATNSQDFPSWMSKNNAHIIAIPMTNIVNAMLSQGRFPSTWKRAEICPIKKIKSPKEFKDMRPISLLYHLAKVAEAVINAILRDSLPQFLNQYAYTNGVGTTDALVKLSTDVVRSLDKTSTIAVQGLLLDFSKAFDLMRPDLVIQRLLDLNIDPTLVHLVKSFLSDRQQCVRRNKQCSPYKDTVIGVPQGTLIGPVLWNIFVDTLQPEIDHIKYADDTSIYNTIGTSDADTLTSTSRAATLSMKINRLATAADYASVWSAQNHMRLNTQKTKTITFSLQKMIASESITINGNVIEEVASTKLLGVTFDQHMRFSDHVLAAIDKSKPAFHAMVQLKRSGAKPSDLLLFYRTRILSILCYAAPVWYPYISSNSKEQLEKQQRLCTKIIQPYTEYYADRLMELNLLELSQHLTRVCVLWLCVQDIPGAPTI